MKSANQNLPGAKHTKPSTCRGRDMSSAGIMPELAYHKLTSWAVSAERYARTGLQSDRPQNSLLIEAFIGWHIGMGYPELIVDEGEEYISVALDKPRREGITKRKFDVVVIAILMAHCIAGGHVRLEPHGPKGDFYYMRLTIYGLDNGRRRRVYILRLAADTPAQLLSVEAKPFRDMRRSSLGAYRAGDSGATLQRFIGREEAFHFTIERVRELVCDNPGALPSGVNEHQIAHLLTTLYNLLDGLPLGQSSVA